MTLGALETLRTQAVQELSAIKTINELNQLKARYLGKKGELKHILSSLKVADPAERASLGQAANDLKQFLEEAIRKKQHKLASKAQEANLLETVDISEPGKNTPKGTFHPLSQTAQDIFHILHRLGFEKASGPEIEHDFYNFEALNIPASHPARDMQDTFYIDDKVMLRTHTSPVQIRAMIAKKNPPLKLLSFGRVYRRDEDITHSPMFHQIEGLFVDEKVSLADLKRTLEILVTELFSADSKIRMRPSFFPFTEPSIEVDVSCFSCSKKEHCRLCKNTGWIEILGAGMVDPEVFHACGYDSEKYRGFAFGLGIERIAMLRYGISDIRLFYENDLRFLRQF